MEQLVLFGDSITQQSVDQSIGFVLTPALQCAYSRKLDVINRGFSGYNTRQALSILPRIVQSPSCSRIAIFSIFFGANDARLPNTGPPEQHIPLDEYKTNLAAMLDSVCLLQHKPRFVLITPPPVNEHKFSQLWRTAKAVSAYAQAVRDLGKERNVAVVDLWTAFMKHAGWDGDMTKPLPGSMDAPKNEFLDRALPDGLHFNGDAYEVLYKEWMKTVTLTYKEFLPSDMPNFLPRWDDESWQQ